MLDVDPIVKDALDRLAPGGEDDPEAILRGAGARAGALRAARTRRLIVGAVAALALVLGGGALAAAKLDLLPWFGEDGPTEATFSIDNTQRYTGPAPETLECPGAGAGDFVCSDGGSRAGNRTYLLTERVEQAPEITRSDLMDGLVRAEGNGTITPGQAARFRQEAGAVGDDFFHAFSVLAGVRTFGGTTASPGSDVELVPPAGVPLWTACRAVDGGFTCHPLARSRDVPVGTPIYELWRGDDWATVPRAANAPISFVRAFHAVLGRDPTSAELRLFFDIATTGTAEGSGFHEGKVEPVSP